MNSIDATERAGPRDDGEAPSLLTLILDTNPHAWALLHDSLSLSHATANLLLFVNAHVAINHANRVAVVASHSDCAEWLYPPPATATTALGAPVQPPDDADKYRPFAHIEHAITTNLRSLISRTSPRALGSTPATMMAGALTRALAYISKQSQALPSGNASSQQFNYSDPASVAGGNDALSGAAHASAGAMGLTSRILILSVSGDLADQYIPIMNSTFACQRLGVPIDILKLAGDTVFLQQAADATGGIYMALDHRARAGFLQYLMFAYLPDQAARKHLVLPGEAEGVDFRAACFCHRRVVDTGFVCSICLSIFCEPLHDSTCLTCGSHLRTANYGQNPVVIPRKKKKKKAQQQQQQQRAPDGAATPERRAGTP